MNECTEYWHCHVCVEPAERNVLEHLRLGEITEGTLGYSENWKREEWEYCNNVLSA